MLGVKASLPACQNLFFCREESLAEAVARNLQELNWKDVNKSSTSELMEVHSFFIEQGKRKVCFSVKMCSRFVYN